MLQFSLSTSTYSNYTPTAKKYKNDIMFIVGNTRKMSIRDNSMSA